MHTAVSSSPNFPARRGETAPPQPRAPLQALAATIADALAQPRDALEKTVTEALRTAVASRDLLRPDQMVGRDDRYTRHCLHSDPEGRFSILALVWKEGQFSPVHGHHTWCAYGVYGGALRETDYRYDAASGTARPNGEVERSCGDVVFSEAGLDEIHRLGNPGGGLGVSIHVYGVAASRIGTDVNWVVRS